MQAHTIQEVETDLYTCHPKNSTLYECDSGRQCFKILFQESKSLEGIETNKFFDLKISTK